MPPRSMANQALLLQKETTPGVPVTTAMKKVHGIRGVPSWNVEAEDFMASGFKVNTARTVNTETGAVSITSLQDYNAMTYTLTGGFGAPESDASGASTVAYEHTYTLDPENPDPLVTFTGVWGDSTQALQLAYIVFNSLGITVNRGGLTLDSSAIGQAPVPVSYPGSGVTQVSSVPVSSRSWSVYADDDYASIGTTKLLAFYEGSFSFGDKYVPDFVVDRSKPSFSDVLEAEETDRSGTFRVGFDATALDLIDSFQDGVLKFFRFESIGPEIEAGINYTIEIDLCLSINNPGEVGAAPNSPARTLPFDVGLRVDPDTGFAAGARLINTVAGL